MGELIATGSPFEPVAVDGKSRVIGQANNVFIFPGLGLGAIVAEAREITDEMFLLAAETLAEMVSPERLAAGALYPAVSELREVSRQIAARVVCQSRDCGVGRLYRDEEVFDAVDWRSGSRPTCRTFPSTDDRVPVLPSGAGADRALMRRGDDLVGRMAIRSRRVSGEPHPCLWTLLPMVGAGVARIPSIWVKPAGRSRQE